MGDRALDPLDHLRARDAERVQLQIGHGRLDHRRAQPELEYRVDVVRHRSGEAPELCPQPSGDDQLDRASVVIGDTREPDFDPVDAELVDEPGDLELLLGAEHHADGLLAVPQRRVVQTHERAGAGRRARRR